MQPQSPGRQLLLLLGVYTLCMFTGQLFIQLILSRYPAEVLQNFEQTNPMMSLWLLALMHICMHLATFFLFLRVANIPVNQVILKARFQPLILLALPVLALLGIVCADVLASLSHDLFEALGYYSVLESSAENRETMTWLLVHNNPSQLALSLFTLCVLPAVGEEFLYRGILQTRLMAATHDRHFSVIISAIIFSAMHMQPTNLLSIALLGLVLGYLYSYTKNIWYGVILHFLVNAIQVIQLYFWPQLME